jgi:hypothetical protein
MRLIDGIVPGLIVGLFFGLYLALCAHPLIALHVRGGRAGAVLWGLLAGVIFGSVGGLIGRVVGGGILTTLACFIALVLLLADASQG